MWQFWPYYSAGYINRVFLRESIIIIMGVSPSQNIGMQGMQELFFMNLKPLEVATLTGLLTL